MPVPLSRRFPCLPLLSLALMALAPFAHAQTPEGPQLPPPDDKVGAVHGQGRLGYYGVTHTFRYQGDYQIGSTFARAAGSPLYLFADVDIQAGQDSTHKTFRPQRLVGTFEFGARRLFGVAPLSLIVRHESAHYIDRADLYQGSWDMVGARWEQAVGKTRVTGTFANYVHVHQLASEYKLDGDLQGVTALGATRGHKMELRSDIHAATGHGGKGGYVDYWIEPNYFLGQQTALFVGYGQIHDTNLSAANTDHPLITGIRLIY